MELINRIKIEDVFINAGGNDLFRNRISIYPTESPNFIRLTYYEDLRNPSNLSNNRIKDLVKKANKKEDLEMTTYLWELSDEISDSLDVIEYENQLKIQDSLNLKDQEPSNIVAGLQLSDSMTYVFQVLIPVAPDEDFIFHLGYECQNIKDQIISYLED